MSKKKKQVREEIELEVGSKKKHKKKRKGDALDGKSKDGLKDELAEEEMFVAEEEMFMYEDEDEDESDDGMRVAHVEAVKKFPFGPVEKFGAYLMLGMFIFIIGIGIWSYNKKTDVSNYFVRTDRSYDEYYDGLTSGQMITGLRVFDFYEYFRKHQKGLFNRTFSRPEWEMNEVDWRPDADGKKIYSRGEDVIMSYRITVKDGIYVTLTTYIDAPEPKLVGDSGDVDKDADTDTNEDIGKVCSNAKISYRGDDEEYHIEKTADVPVVMANAVFDTNSPFFCARETFEAVIALFESERLEKYPNNPFIGLMDEAAPDDYQSELLKRFLIDEPKVSGDSTSDSDDSSSSSSPADGFNAYYWSKYWNYDSDSDSDSDSDD